MAIPRPGFEGLPLVKGDPPYSAWGLWGEQDELGTLNLLKDDVVAAAAKSEIQNGHRISLDWPLDKIAHPSFGRQKFHQELLKKPNRLANDDVITMNTQSSSQWDGLRHFGYQKEGLFYNRKTNEDFHGSHAGTVNGVQNMASRGICGRAVLIDHVSYARRHGLFHDALSHHSIPLSEILAAAQEQGTKLQPADILIIRSGFVEKFETMTSEERAAMAQALPSFTGVETGPEFAKWIWDSQFSAVAGDAPSFEAWPPKVDYSLHEVLLAGWGCPIAELLDLEELASYCKTQKRWSFFLASIPLKNPGGAASPANCMAIF